MSRDAERVEQQDEACQQREKQVEASVASICANLFIHLRAWLPHENVVAGEVADLGRDRVRHRGERRVDVAEGVAHPGW